MKYQLEHSLESLTTCEVTFNYNWDVRGVPARFLFKRITKRTVEAITASLNRSIAITSKYI